MAAFISAAIMTDIAVSALSYSSEPQGIDKLPVYINCDTTGFEPQEPTALGASSVLSNESAQENGE